MHRHASLFNWLAENWSAWVCHEFTRNVGRRCVRACGYVSPGEDEIHIIHSHYLRGNASNWCLDMNDLRLISVRRHFGDEFITHKFCRFRRSTTSEIPNDDDHFFEISRRRTMLFGFLIAGRRVHLKFNSDRITWGIIRRILHLNGYGLVVECGWRLFLLFSRNDGSHVFVRVTFSCQSLSWQFFSQIMN